MDATAPTLIQSLQRGMKLIDIVAERGPLTAKSLSDSTGIVVATVYRLVRTLVHEGYLVRTQDGRYALGSQFASVAELEGRARDYRLVREAMARLTAATRSHVMIGGLMHGDVEIWSMVEHPAAPQIDCWPGVQLPGHATAIGKSILAHAGAGQREAYLSQNPLHGYTCHTIATSARLERHLVACPLSVSDQEFRYGVTCLAAPLADTSMPAALGLAFASGRSVRTRDELEEHLLAAAAKISKLLVHSRLTRSRVVA
ncbi:IclR family transcriptional regulator C-terminal domain-containing protein [Mycobacterium sp. AMU20-3851]|uniref:IclR family transcriptional regulator n=1 Tax=Mycobacterium sp. AMU20-3851 TaxID=3122055 RepID=UPI00375463D7